MFCESFVFLIELWLRNLENDRCLRLLMLGYYYYFFSSNKCSIILGWGEEEEEKASETMKKWSCNEESEID